MFGHTKPEDADRRRQNPLYMSRIYDDLDRSSHHSSPSPERDILRNMQQAMRPKGKIPNIAIVGAGISGLRCADVLIKSGARVTMYEARDRIGGRVHQVVSGGHLMDLGANWVHGTENNPIADIARRTRTITHDIEERQAVIDSQGNRLDESLASELSETVWGIIVKAFRYSDEKSAEIDKSKSLMDYFREQVPKIEKDPRKQSLILEQAHMWGAFVGDSLERQGLKFFFLEECIDGENVFVAGTYKAIVADIAATALANADIHFNEEVVFFETTHGAQARSSPQVTVHTRSGIRQTYDEVVLTAPLGWLKRHKDDAFPPSSPLPPRLIQAIDNSCYGKLEKVYITFPTAFWQQDTVASAASSTDASHISSSSLSLSSSSSSPSSSYSSSSSRSCPPTYPSSTHFFTPEYTSHPADTPWNQTLVSLAALPDSAAHPTLLFYLYGACGTHLVNLLKDIPVSTSPSSPYHTALRSFFQPYYSRLPNYAPQSASCVPTAFLATRWQLDPLAGNGSYVNFQVGQENADQDIETMREGVGEERGLWLAGEHTAPFIALGTTTGAYWSGEGLARRIVAMYDALEADGEEEEEEKAVGKKKPSVEETDAANMNGLAL